MKTLALIVALFIFHVLAYGQLKDSKYAAHGIIRSRANDTKLTFTLLSLINNDTHEERLTMSDFHGKFCFNDLQNGNYTLKVTGENYYIIDSTITIKNKSLRHIKMYFTTDCHSYDANAAQQDIKNESVKLLLQGGDCPAYDPRQIFSKKNTI